MNKALINKETREECKTRQKIKKLYARVLKKG
jgi:hypothetical protein